MMRNHGHLMDLKMDLLFYRFKNGSRTNFDYINDNNLPTFGKTATVNDNMRHLATRGAKPPRFGANAYSNSLPHRNVSGTFWNCTKHLRYARERIKTQGIPWWSIHSCDLWMFIHFSPSNYDLLELLIYPHIWIILDICLVGYITPKYDVLNISKHHRPRSHRRKSQQVQPLLHAQRPTR